MPELGSGKVNKEIIVEGGVMLVWTGAKGWEFVVEVKVGGSGVGGSGGSGDDNGG